MMIFSNGPMSSAQKGATKPPCSKPLAGSSSGPPGACMIPSSDTKAAPVSLRIGGLAAERRLDLRDVDFLHGHHRVHGSLGRRPVRTGDRGDERTRGDLP